MPKRFITYSRNEPTRQILWSVAVITLITQVAAMILAWPVGIANLAVVGPVAGWAIWSSVENNVAHMSRSSFALCMLYLWTGLTRLFFVEGVGQLLWVPFLIVTAVMATLYLYFSFQRRGVVSVRVGDLD